MNLHRLSIPPVCCSVPGGLAAPRPLLRILYMQAQRLLQVPIPDSCTDEFTLTEDVLSDLICLYGNRMEYKNSMCYNVAICSGMLCTIGHCLLAGVECHTILLACYVIVILPTICVGTALTSCCMLCTAGTATCMNTAITLYRKLYSYALWVLPHAWVLPALYNICCCFIL